MKKSIPTPLSANLVAVFFHSLFSGPKSFLSVSVPWALPSSRNINRPGPQVGKLANEHIIFPPVACKAENAALITGRTLGSGFLIWENNVGIWVRRDEMTSLQLILTSVRVLPSLGNSLTLTRRDRQVNLHSEEQMVPRDQSLPSSVPAQGWPI